jgi:hypothetical protein
VTTEAPPDPFAPYDFPPFEGVETRSTDTSIVGIEVDVDRAGTVTRLELDTNPDHIELHNQVRLTICGPMGLHHDQILMLPGLHEWYDLRRLVHEQGGVLPSGIREPGTRVRVAPYLDFQPVQGQELLAIQATLDAVSGSGRFVYGNWASEWPSSLWSSGLVSGVDGHLRRAFAVARREVLDLCVVVRVFEVGHGHRPMIQSEPADGAACVAWESGGFVGIELTHTVGQLTWDDLREAVLEMDAYAPDDPDPDPRRMHVPITAR